MWKVTKQACGSTKAMEGTKSTSTLDSSKGRRRRKLMATQRNDQGHYGYTEKQVATKTDENGRRDDPQREPWGDRWDARSNHESKKLPSTLKNQRISLIIKNKIEFTIGGK